uniref:Neuronal tyrosine phosphorylated phosphoinositide-3-kinase adaptor 1 n=1 Tax=Cyprinus carpio TaxID=7962 RepID=A0A8C2AY00_CYPCA
MFTIISITCIWKIDRFLFHANFYIIEDGEEESKQRKNKKKEGDSNYKDASSATVGKVRDLASFRRHFRMGFMTMPASQDLSPHSCAAAMAPRSQSCHAVGTGEGEEMENGYYPDSDPQNQSNPSRCPPTKPKRHPNTRLSSTPQQEHPSRGVHAPPDTPPPPPPNHPTKHPEKRNGRKVPPLKPKRSPSTQLSFDPLPPRVQHPTTPLPFQSSEPSPRGEGGDDEPVYIEMVGQVFTRETHSTPTPHPLTPSATTPDSESDHGEAIYEEMKYPLPDDLAREHTTPPSSHPPHPLPPHSRAPHPPLQLPSSSKIPAPFPNLLQHKPPLLAFPQPAAASSGVGAQHKTSSAKISVQSASSLTASTSTSSSMSSTCTSKESSGVEKEREKERREGQLGPAPGLRARSHSTPLPPSSKSSSPYSHHHHHHHPHHRPSHYHHYRKPEKEASSSSKGTGQSSTQTQTQPKEGKSVSFLLKSEKSERERDRERDRERERDLSTPSSSHSDTPASNTYTHTSQTGTSTTPTLSQPSSSTAATPPSTSSSSTQRPPSRSHMHRTHTPHLSHGLPAYKPPPSDSPLLWTYPSVGFRRPPAYDSLRGGSQLPSLHTDPTKTGSAAQALQAKAGFIPWESTAALGLTEEQAYWPMHRKLSFSHGSRDTEKEDGGAWNGSSDALLRRERDDLGAMRGGGHSGIPVWATGRHSESLAGADGPPGLRGLIRAGLPLPCQTFPACRNGELGRLGRSSSTSGVRQVGGDVQRQSSLPTREAFNQVTHLAQLAAQAQAPLSTGTAGTSTTSAQRDGKLLEVIERKRCLCKEIKAHRRPDKSLCKQDSMPILPSWRKTPEPRKTGTPPCQRPQAVVWDTAI